MCGSSLGVQIMRKTTIKQANYKGKEYHCSWEGGGGGNSGILYAIIHCMDLIWYLITLMCTVFLNCTYTCRLTFLFVKDFALIALRHYRD